MKALLVKPMKKPEVIEIENNLSSLQNAVGGYIEAVYPWADAVAIVCNEEGKINNLPLNRIITVNGELYDVIAGDFLLCGLSCDDFESLTDDMIEKYTRYFSIAELMVTD